MTDISFSPLAQRLRDAVAFASRAPIEFGADAVLDRANDQIGIGKIVDLPRIPDSRGSLTFIEGGGHIPFDIKRVYYLYDVPGGATRGGHAHKGLHQLLIAMAGSFDIILDNGKKAQRHSLNRSYFGLHIPPMTWREMENFSSGAVCLVLASEHYDEADYYRNYEAFMEGVQASR